MRNQNINISRTFFVALIKYFYAEYNYRAERYGNLKKVVSNFNGHHQSVSYFYYYSNKNSVIAMRQSYHSARGRAYGQHVCQSKSYRRAFSFYKVNLAVSNLTFFFSLVRLYYVPQLTKLYGLVLASNGRVYTTPVTARMALFRLSCGCLFFSTFSWERELTITFKYLRKCDSLLYMRLQSQVCLLSAGVDVLPMYIRAPGCVGVVMRKFFLQKNACVLVCLPSGAAKMFSVCISAFFGYVCLREHIFLKNTRAGFHRKLGSRPMVRGVVKNPVDHPHGGRERTVL